MKFANINIGGKEVFPVQVSFIGDQRRGRELEGYGRVLLGNMKQIMVLGGVKSLKENHKLPQTYESGSLLHYMLSGDLDGTVPLKLAAVTMVDVTINSQIYTASTIGEGSMADTDLLEIFVDTSYSIKLNPKAKVVGFTVHFRDTSNWQQNVNYIVAEPYKTSSLSVGVTARSRDDISYTDLEAWRKDILNYGVASSNFFSPYWFRTFGWQYRETTGSPIYDQAAPILGGDYKGNGSDLTIIPTIKSVNDQVAFELRYTAYGLYAISKPDFNHVDAGKYDFENGFVGKVECFLKIRKKKIEETAKKYNIPFINDVAGGFDETVLTGDNLLVNNPNDFLDGWYGIGMVTWDQGSGKNNNIGGFTFIWHMDDGSKRIKKFHDIQLASGNMAGAGTSSDINSGTAFALFNPKLGLLNLYEGVSDADNPFFDSNASYRNNFYPALRKDFDKDLKPTRTFNVYEDDSDVEMDVTDPPIF